MNPLKVVHSTVMSCTKCQLANEGRINPVFGNGKTVRPDLMFIGEGPGAEEDQCGIPFSGRAGREFNKLLKALGYSRDSVYMDNVVKCRPLQNRTPTTGEVESCHSYLDQQIKIIKPKVIVCIGKTSASSLMGVGNKPMKYIQGTWKTYDGIPITTIYHPAYWLRLENYDKKAWKEVKIKTFEIMRGVVKKAQNLEKQNEQG